MLKNPRNCRGLVAAYYYTASGNANVVVSGEIHIRIDSKGLGGCCGWYYTNLHVILQVYAGYVNQSAPSSTSASLDRGTRR